MKEEIELEEELDDNSKRIRLYHTDWRYSASVVGLCRFFEFCCKNNLNSNNFEIHENFIEYDELILDDYKSDYLLFAEYYFRNEMHHNIVEDRLNMILNKEIIYPKDEVKAKKSKEEIEKLINEKLKGNTIMKSFFKNIKYSVDESTEEDIREILNIIDKNRLKIIEETYKNGLKLYRKFLQDSKIFSNKGDVCRIKGYYVDAGRKIKSISYKFQKSYFVYEDELEFDFLVFGFSRSRQAFFINNNIGTVRELVKVNNNLQSSIDNELVIQDSKYQKVRPKQLLFQYNKSSANLSYAVELICKNEDDSSDCYETIFVKDEALNIFKKIKGFEYELLTRPCKIGNNFVDIEKIVVDAVLNNVFLDTTIKSLLKDNASKSKEEKLLYSYYNLVRVLVKINNYIYNNNIKGGKIMYSDLREAERCGMKINRYFSDNNQENKLRSYEQKLVSAVTFDDYDKIIKILLQFRGYTKINMPFLLEFINSDQSGNNNNNLIYAFITGLGIHNNKEENKEDK